MGDLTALTDSTFDEHIAAADKPVIVDFWAEWCGPCRMVTPILEEIAKDHSNDVEVVKVNVDDEQGVAMRYGIQSIPTMILFDKGEMKERVIGAMGKEQLLAQFKPHFSA